MELKEAKKLSKFIEEMRKKNHSVTYNQNDDLLQDLEVVLQALDNSIPKKKVKEGIEHIEDYFDRLNGPDEDVEFIRKIKQELLEGENEK